MYEKPSFTYYLSQEVGDLTVLLVSVSLAYCTCRRRILSLPDSIINSMTLLLRNSKNMIDHARLASAHYIFYYIFCVPVRECVCDEGLSVL